MGVGAVVVSADWVALASLCEAPTPDRFKQPSGHCHL
jgi:hypothetical protein